jgi:hypothetical protein
MNEKLIEESEIPKPIPSSKRQNLIKAKPKLWQNQLDDMERDDIAE